MIRDGFWFLSNSVCVFYPWALGRWQKNNELEKSYTIANHLSSYYHMFNHVFWQTTNSTFSVNIVVVRRTTLFVQDQELETKIKTKRIKLYKQTFHFLTISDQLMKEIYFWSTFERNLLKSILHIIFFLTFQLHVYYFVTFSIYVNLSTLLLEQRKGEEEYLLWYQQFIW